jgi:hypothetical protein
MCKIYGFVLVSFLILSGTLSAYEIMQIYLSHKKKSNNILYCGNFQQLLSNSRDCCDDFEFFVAQPGKLAQDEQKSSTF